jgi:hypothetical protein
MPEADKRAELRSLGLPESRRLYVIGQVSRQKETFVGWISPCAIHRRKPPVDRVGQ